MLTIHQTLEENRDEFIARLLEAGWSKADALKEWDEVQSDEEAGP